MDKKVPAPAISYIHRDIEVVSIQARITVDVKDQAQDVAKKLDTSLNRLIEAALKYYMDKLKEEGSI